MYVIETDKVSDCCVRPNDLFVYDSGQWLASLVSGQSLTKKSTKVGMAAVWRHQSKLRHYFLHYTPRMPTEREAW